LDNAIQEFSKAQPPWVMSHYIVLYKYGKHMPDFWGIFIFILVYFSIFGGVFNKTVISLALVGYEMTKVNLALQASLTIYHLISNARSWSNC